MNRTNNQNQKGAVAIFVVVFAALFITIITVSFVGIMLKNQTASVNADLSDSAYDSSLAGVEDAKRLFQKYKECEAAGELERVDNGCKAAKDAIEGAGCFGVRKFITQDATATGPTSVQRTADSASKDKALDQAYTCVKLELNVRYRENSIAANTFDVVPLALKDAGGSTFDTIKISWYSRNVTGSDHPTGSFAYGTFGQFPAPAGWDITKKAPVLRTQFVNLSGASLDLKDFDYTSSARRAGTSFLYPQAGGSSTVAILPSPGPVTPIKCTGANTVGNSIYHCTATLSLPAQPVSPASYLILSPIYGPTHYAIQVFNSVTDPTFVNPYVFTNVANVDSTGRANDLYRRVKAQIELDTNSGGGSPTYPAAAVEVGQLCKNFSITDNPSDFSSVGCNP